MKKTIIFLALVLNGCNYVNSARACYNLDILTSQEKWEGFSIQECMRTHRVGRAVRGDERMDRYVDCVINVKNIQEFFAICGNI